ncbi:MAG: fimbria/pilus periplasmic chaperone [Brachymonas sp.]|nr:fimbria/pilus periplasmic chaperone [Brachymonas sp.]
MKRFFCTLRTALVAGCALLAAATAGAAALQISPVSLSLPAGERAGMFTLGNASAEPITAQVRVFRWTQNAEGEDVLQPTSNVVVSPPMVQIAANGEQQFRVIRTQPSGQAEETYRLIVDELPAPSATPKKGLQLVLRYSVPVFLNTAQNPETTLQWRAEPGPTPKSSVLTIRNSGAAHAQISRVWVSRGEGKEALSISNGLFGYVLSGQTIRRTVAVSPEQLRSGTFTAIINGRETSPGLVFAP